MTVKVNSSYQFEDKTRADVEFTTQLDGGIVVVCEQVDERWAYWYRTSQRVMALSAETFTTPLNAALARETMGMNDDQAQQRRAYLTDSAWKGFSCYYCGNTRNLIADPGLGVHVCPNCR